jgi:ribosomal protein S18 acetylase RimI-like enzyme
VSGPLPDACRLRFEPVGEAQANILLSLACAFHAEEGRSLDADSAAAVLGIARGEPLARGWIVHSAGRAAGYVVITLGFSIEYGGRDGFIDDLYLVPEVRGRGWGRCVLDFACREAKRLGIKTLHLEVEVGNDRAARLYRGAGFEQTGRRLMRLRLQS